MNSDKCPRCGIQLPPDAPQGLCPRCLGALNLTAETVFPGGRPEEIPLLSPAELGAHFPQLEITECLGRGGMGVVYKARQKTLNRAVALKLLAPERAGDEKFAAHFTREAQALARLNHPNIVTVYDFGQAGGFYYLLMEFVDGVNLRQLLKSGKLAEKEALAIVPPVCEALQYAHDQGIVHRDIKPENLLLDKAGRVKIADFGVAKIVSDPASHHQSAGTPSYMAPEQRASPERSDHRADIYSLGVVLYELLTGELPNKDLGRPSRRLQVDVRLDEIVLRALETRPELRFRTAGDLGAAVERVSETSIGRRAAFGSSIQAWSLKRWLRPRLAWRAAAVGLVLFLAFLFWPRRPMISPPEFTKPHVDFTVMSVEVPTGSHEILVHFVRDSNPALGLIVGQDMTPSPDGKQPAEGYRTWKDRQWLTAKDEPVIHWQLPQEFTEEQVLDTAHLIEFQNRGIKHLLPERSMPRFADVRHPDGWSYELYVRVLKSSDWGTPRAFDPWRSE